MTGLLRKFHPSRSAAWSVLVVALVYLSTLGFLEIQGFWIIDNGNKFLQMQAIQASGYRDYSLPWPGQEFDPEFEFNPIPAPFSYIQDGKLYSFYPPFFATVSTVFYRLFGMAGLYVIPWLSAVGMLAGLARLAGLLGGSARARAVTVLLGGLCTPLWFYSVVFWEHMPAVCLAVWAVSFVVRAIGNESRRDLIIGSALATFSIYFRDEFYLLCGVLVALLLVSARSDRFRVVFVALATMAVAILPLWIFQGLALGHPLGFHVLSQTASGVFDHVLQRPKVIYVLFLAFVPQIGASLVLSAPFALAFLWGPKLTRDAFGKLLPIAAAVATLFCGISLTGMARAESPISWLNQSNGLFAAAPILMLAFLRVRTADGSLISPVATRLWIIALAYSALYVLAAPGDGSQGIHWGNRLLLILYPLLIVIAAQNLVLWFDEHGLRRRLGVLSLVATLMVSGGAQIYSIALLQERKQFSHRLSQSIEHLPEKLVLTDLWWLPQDLFAVFQDKAIFYAKSSDEVEKLLRRLRALPDERLLFVTRRGGAGHGALIDRIDDGSLNFFAVDVYRFENR